MTRLSEGAVMNSTSSKSGELFQSLKLGEISVFGALTTAQLESLWQYLEVQSFAAGQRVFSQGDLPSDIYIVISGKVDFIVEKDDVFNVEGCFETGQTFGESAFLGIQPHVGSTQVRSIGSAELLTFTRDSLIKMQEQDLELFTLVLMNFARDLSRKYQALIS